MLKKIILSTCLIIGSLSINAQEYKVGFYSDFEPISYSASRNPNDEDFNRPLGYEADLIRAIEAIPSSEMNFKFHGIKEWNHIWLSPFTDHSIDIALGGITKEARRLLNSHGDQVVMNTHKTVDFKQSLLVHAEDAEKIKNHSDLTSDYIVGAVKGTTGEYRYLAQSHIIESIESGKLLNGFIVVLENGNALTSDGTLNIYDPKLETRSMIIPPNSMAPFTKYFVAEDSMIPALERKEIHAIARGYIGNKLIADRSNNKLVVTAIYSLECPPEDSINCTRKEESVFFVKVQDVELLEKLNQYIDYLTDFGKISYDDWQQNNQVFLERALNFNP